MEIENDCKLSFLDIVIDNKTSDSIVTSVFHKATFTGLYTNFNSFTSFSYKIGLVRTLVDRCYKINNTWAGLHKDLERLTCNLMQNAFPRHIIERVIQRRINQSLAYAPPPKPKPQNVRYYCIPYVGYYSKIAQRKLRQLSQKYCKTNVFQLVFRSLKVSNILNVKDRIPLSLRSHVVYEFKCSHCGVTYLGETTRHLTTRVNEHLVSAKNSNVNRHVNSNTDCKIACGNHCFNIIDSDNNEFRLKLRESFHILRRSPLLNAQLAHESLTLLY